MREASVGRDAFAVIYCRVSSLRQVTEGDGLNSQETRCREYAARKGYEVVAVFRDEGVSGSVNKRPAMQKMLDLLRGGQGLGTHTVIIDDISRLARGLAAHLDLRAAIKAVDARLESPSLTFGHDPDSIMVENLLATVAQHFWHSSPRRRK